jgi:DNA-binding transcriptional LysR family regulator
MTLRQLQYFQQVCQWGGITAAAEKLHVSQPSITNSIKALEEEFHILLFKRENRKLTLTFEGELFYIEATHVLQDVNDLTQKMKDLSRSRNQIKLAISPTVETFLFSKLVIGFKKLHPHVTIDVLELGALECYEVVEKGQVDFAITITNYANLNAVRIITLLTTRLNLAVHKESPMAGLSSMSLQELSAIPLVVNRIGSFSNKIISTAFEKANLKPNIIFRSNQLDTIKQLLRSDYSIGGLLFDETILNNADIVGIPIVPQFDPIFIGILWNKERPLYSDSTAFINYTKRQFSDRTSS